MAWGYKQSNGLFNGYDPQTYPDESAGKNPTTGSGNDWTWAYGSPQNFKSSGGSSGGRGGYAGGGGSSRSTNQVSKLRFTEPMPEMPDLPTLTLPKSDPRKVRALTQRLAAPSIRKLQEGLQAGMNTSSDNPNVRRMTLREALQGYGTGLESALAGAGSQARAENQQDVNRESQEATANWQAKNNAIMTAYNNAFNRYMQSAERVTESNQTTGEAGGVPTVVRRNVWGTPEIGPAFGYSPREVNAFGYPTR